MNEKKKWKKLFKNNPRKLKQSMTTGNLESPAYNNRINPNTRIDKIYNEDVAGYELKYRPEGEQT